MIQKFLFQPFHFTRHHLFPQLAGNSNEPAANHVASRRVLDAILVHERIHNFTTTQANLTRVCLFASGTTASWFREVGFMEKLDLRWLRKQVSCSYSALLRCIDVRHANLWLGAYHCHVVQILDLATPNHDSSRHSLIVALRR